MPYNAIIKIAPNAYFLERGGHRMTLTKVRDEGAEWWEMRTVNAAVRAWRRGYPLPKYFKNLDEVEAKYKTWRGIAALVATEETLAAAPGPGELGPAEAGH